MMMTHARHLCDLAAAEVTFGVDGRVESIGVVDTAASSGCMKAALVLFVTYIAPLDMVAAGGQQALLMLPFVKELVDCHDVPLEEGSVTVLSKPIILRKRPDVTPPKTINRPKPVYPPDMTYSRISGEVYLEGVVAATGCLRSARVTRSVHPQLDWSAMRAVAAWRFTPAQIGGTRVAVGVTIAVDFNLK